MSVYYSFFFKSIFLFVLSFPICVYSQCIADYEHSNQGYIYEFQDISTTTSGDSIIAWSWDFGDGEKGISQTISHTYQSPESYDVSLIIGTQNGCIDTIIKTITLCNLTIQTIRGEDCIGNQQEVLVQITDQFEVVDSVDITLDGFPLTPSRYAIDKDLNLNLLIDGNTNITTLNVASEYSSECSEQYFISPKTCENNCNYTNISVKPNKTAMVEVRDTVFFQKNKIITLGDSILWKWVSPGNSSTSDSTSGPNSWDSGVRFVNDSFKVAFNTLGVNPYYSKTRGGPHGQGMSGNIIVNCPIGQEKEIEIKLEHDLFESSGFVIAVDGVIIQDSIFSYSETGISYASIILAADGIEHKITAIDLDNKSCYISSTALIPDCGGVQACQLNIDGYAAMRCITDSIDVTLDVNSLGASSQGLAVLQNGSNYIDTLYPNLNGKVSITYRVPYTTTDQNFEIQDISNTLCSAETVISIPDCTLQCQYSNLEISKTPTNFTDVVIGNNGIAQKDIGLGFGKSIVFHWNTDKNYGVRSQSGSWDSGIGHEGSLYLSPIFKDGPTTYEVYNHDGNIVSTGNIWAKESCEEGKVALFVSFIENGGSAAGYSVFVDEVLYSSDFNYANASLNTICLQLIGDDREHVIEIRDNSQMDCSIVGSVDLVSCAEFDCTLDISVTELDSCYNNNSRELDIEIYNPNPFPIGFTLLRNGEQLGEVEIKYELDSFTNIIDTIFSEGEVYTYTVFDVFNATCRDSVTIEPETCVTNCIISNLTLRSIDADYKLEFPNTPNVFVGCQSDSTHYIAATFDEKYSDASQYVIFVDNQIFTTVNYNEGDGQNIAFIPVLANGELHTIRIADMVATDCYESASIITPECYQECRIFVEDYSISSCLADSFDLNIILNDTISLNEISIYESGSGFDFSLSDDTVKVRLLADGELKNFTLFETDNILCQSYLDFTAPYCLECNINYQLTQLDSCSSDDLITFEIDISENEDSELLFSINGMTQTISTATPTEFKIIADGSTSNLELKSTTDVFCSRSFGIATLDCAPAICEVDFTVETQGLQAVFTDNSTTSEPITRQNWVVPGSITIEDVSSFTWNFANVGIYTICHTIVTDSCTNTICKDIQIDPCLNLISDFEETHKGNGNYEFTNKSSGEVDTYLYDFGDGNTSTEENPLHTFINGGLYNVCLVVSNTEFECSDTLCRDIDFVTQTSDPIDNIKLDIFPNPSSSEQSITIKSSIPMNGYEIFSTNGKLMQSADFSIGMDKISFRVDGHTNDGLLLINIKTKKGTFVRKLIQNL